MATDKRLVIKAMEKTAHGVYVGREASPRVYPALSKRSHVTVSEVEHESGPGLLRFEFRKRAKDKRPLCVVEGGSVGGLTAYRLVEENRPLPE